MVEAGANDIKGNGCGEWFAAKERTGSDTAWGAAGGSGLVSKHALAGAIVLRSDPVEVTPFSATIGKAVETGPGLAILRI